jgi:hypothetical protein
MPLHRKYSPPFHSTSCLRLKSTWLQQGSMILKTSPRFLNESPTRAARSSFCNFRQLHKRIANLRLAPVGHSIRRECQSLLPTCLQLGPAAKGQKSYIQTTAFLYLPIEIRPLIWQHYLDIPRVIAIEVVPDANRHSRKIIYGQQS